MARCVYKEWGIIKRFVTAWIVRALKYKCKQSVRTQKDAHSSRVNDHVPMHSGGAIIVTPYGYADIAFAPLQPSTFLIRSWQPMVADLLKGPFISAYNSHHVAVILQLV